MRYVKKVLDFLTKMSLIIKYIHNFKKNIVLSNRIQMMVSCKRYLFLALCIPSLVLAVGGDYIIRPGDVVAIKVLEHDEFSQQVKIRPDGKINYPVIGELTVDGLTAPQLVKLMEEKLSPYINNVAVSVQIEQYYSNKIYILGAVNHSGEFKIFEPLDIMKALALCGGAKVKKVKKARIVRASGNVLDVDLTEFFNSTNVKASETYLLFPGDTLFIPETWAFPWGMTMTILQGLNLVLLVLFGIQKI